MSRLEEVLELRKQIQRQYLEMAQEIWDSDLETCKKDSKARIIRDGIVIYDGEINTIQREKDTVKEVKKGLECGITIENYNDIREQDIIEAYEMVEIKR